MDIPRASQELKENSAEYQIFIDALGQLFKWIKQLVSIFLSKSVSVCHFNLFLGQRAGSRRLWITFILGQLLTKWWCIPCWSLCWLCHQYQCFNQNSVIGVMKTSVLFWFYLTAQEENFSLWSLEFCWDFIFQFHYIGKRASVVLYTDRAFRAWAKNRNGWDYNAFMHTIKRGIPDFEL